MSKTVGDKVTELLQTRKMSRADLARLTGLSTGLLSDICNNNRTSIVMETAQRIARALGIHPSYFFEEDVVGPANTFAHMTEEQKKIVDRAEFLPWIGISQKAARKGIRPERFEKLIDIIVEDNVE